MEGLSSTLFFSILDIILVSFLIYQILLFLRGTRAIPMLAGLGILFLVYIMATRFNLVTLSWLLSNFLGSVILVVVVLFQDDLRRVFTKVGLMPSFGVSSSRAREKSIEEITKTAVELSSRRLGGLMVIKRDVGLEDFVEHAIPIDAVVSHQLLVSIFLPTSPLHDGAVIVDGNRIVAAGAFLPLTFDPSVSSSLGTRHRAALGLSEHSDSVIVVVSEETGTISLVRDGRLTRDLTEKSLYNALYRLTVLRYQKREQILEKYSPKNIFKRGQGEESAQVAPNNSDNVSGG